jgi:hypothetical protein
MIYQLNDSPPDPSATGGSAEVIPAAEEAVMAALTFARSKGFNSICHYNSLDTSARLSGCPRPAGCQQINKDEGNIGWVNR